MAGERLRAAAARIAGRLELPAELIAGVPRVCITGKNEVTVEQHRGVAHCTPDEICVRAADGLVRVTGAELRIRKMDKNIIALTGCVYAVALEGTP